MLDGAAHDASLLDRLDGPPLLRAAMVDVFPDRLAVVSSFGTESAVLLSMAAEINPSVPVLFLDTGRHFAETIAYREALTRRLGLTDVRILHPDPDILQAKDANLTLAAEHPDACCAMRKVAPLEQGLAGFSAWVSGRKRYQSSVRASLFPVEWVDGRVKLNPLAGWSPADVAAEHIRRGLPSHPLTAQGFRSIGCAPCTRPVAQDEEGRAGRWAGLAKSECGIHRTADGRIVRAAH